MSKAATNSLDPDPADASVAVIIEVEPPMTCAVLEARDEMVLEEMRLELEEDEAAAEDAGLLEFAVAVGRDVSVAGASGEEVARMVVEAPGTLRTYNRVSSPYWIILTRLRDDGRQR